jgi:hypothetical protein
MPKKKCEKGKTDKKKDRDDQKFQCKSCGAGANKAKELCKPKKN